MLNRCYPTLSDLIRDLTGLNIPLPVYSYGFCVTLGFLAAAIVLILELKRKEKQGLVRSFKKEVITGEAATAGELIGKAIIGFVAGFKLVFIVFNYGEFASRPQEVLFSAAGSWPGGIAGALLLAFLKFYEKHLNKLDQPQKTIVEVHPYQTVGGFTMVAAITGILGAKLFHFFESPGNFQEFLRDPFGTFFNGLTVYGGLIVGAMGVIWYSLRKGINPIHVMDVTPALLLAYSFGRMGCQISGDGDWGIVNTFDKPSWLSWLPDGLWSFNYPYNIIDAGTRIPGCMEVHCYVLPQGVFPTPIYESTTTLLLFFLLWSLRKHITIPGLMLSFYAILTGIQRYLIEKIRVNTTLDFFGIEMTQAEFISILYILAGFAGIIYFTHKNKSR